jgi:4-amino-4-deoxy-L-arabinose transferase-like glycosyltransferase
MDRLKSTIALCCFAALCAAMIFHSLTQNINQDEEQYITAAYLAQHMRLYADFLYLQLPIYPLVLSKLFMLFANVSPFLVARLLSAALAIGSVVVFFNLATRLSASVPFAFILTSLFASAPLMLRAYGLTRNDIMPIFFGLCGVWLLLRGLSAEDKQRGRVFALFLAGVCMALAVGAKATAAFIPLSALLYIFVRAKRQLLPFVIGGAAGSLPIVYYAATAFDKFLYCNVLFRLIEVPEFYSDIGQAERLTWPYRAKSVIFTWVAEPTLVVASLFLAFVAFIALRRNSLFQTTAKRLTPDRIFILLLVPAAIPFVFLPNPFGWPYLQPAVPYVLLSCAALYPLARKILEPREMLTCFAIAVVVLTLQLGRFAIEAEKQMERPMWTVTEVHDLAALIARHVNGGAVATLYPALVLDAGSPIYPEFATSPYFFRAGDHLAPEQVLELNAVSPRTLPLVLAAKPPIAVFAGNTADDASLLNWVRQNCYLEVDLANWREGGLYDEGWKPRLFMRPHQQELCQRSWLPKD